MRFIHNPPGSPEPIALMLSHAECGRLLGLIDVAIDNGFNRTGIAERVAFAYDASEFGPRVEGPGTRDQGTGHGSQFSVLSSQSSAGSAPLREPLLREALGGDPSAAIAEAGLVASRQSPVALHSALSI